MLLGVKVMSNEPDFMGTLMITLILQPSSSFHTKWRGNKHVTESNFSKVVAQKNKRERERIAETRMHMQAAIICCSLIFFMVSQLFTTLMRFWIVPACMR